MKTKWIAFFKLLTCNYYVWLVTAWTLWPLLVLIDAAVQFGKGMREAWREIVDGFSGPGWRRENYEKLRKHYHRK